MATSITLLLSAAIHRSHGNCQPLSGSDRRFNYIAAIGVVKLNKLKGRGSEMEPMQPQVYDALKFHQLQQFDWNHNEVMKVFHKWQEIFTVEFKLELPPVALCVGQTRRNCFGYYRPGHNQFGVRREILIQERYLREHIEQGEFWRTLGTLLHEILHAWKDFRGVPGKGNYHNKQLCAKAAEYGLLIDPRGYTEYEPASPFFALLQKHGVTIPVVPPRATKTIGQSKLKKWSCVCNPAVNVRVAIADFRALCMVCDTQFQQAY